MSDACAEVINSPAAVFVLPELPVGDGDLEQVKRELREYDLRLAVRDQIRRIRAQNLNKRVQLAICDAGVRRLSFRNPDGQNDFELANRGAFLGVVVFCPGRKTTVLPGVSRDDVLFPLIAECGK